MVSGTGLVVMVSVTETMAFRCRFPSSKLGVFRHWISGFREHADVRSRDIGVIGSGPFDLLILIRSQQFHFCVR